MRLRITTKKKEAAAAANNITAGQKIKDIEYYFLNKNGLLTQCRNIMSYLPKSKVQYKNELSSGIQAKSYCLGFLYKQPIQP